MEKYKEYLHSIISVEIRRACPLKNLSGRHTFRIVLKMVAVNCLYLRSHEEAVGTHARWREQWWIIRAMPCSIFLLNRTCDVDLNKVTTSVKSASGKNKNNENIHHLRLRKGDAMNQQIWIRMAAASGSIEGFCHTLTNDVQRIEYKPLSYKVVAAKWKEHNMLEHTKPSGSIQMRIFLGGRKLYLGILSNLQYYFTDHPMYQSTVSEATYADCACEFREFPLHIRRRNISLA